MPSESLDQQGEISVRIMQLFSTQRQRTIDDEIDDEIAKIEAVLRTLRAGQPAVEVVAPT